MQFDFQQFRRWLLGLGAFQKACFAALALCTGALLVFLVRYDPRDGYRPVAENLAGPADCDALLERLQADGISGRASEDGRAVHVAESDVAKAKLVVADREPAPRRSQKMLDELSRKSAYLLSAEERRILNQSTLESHLVENLLSYEMIHDAKVNLSLPSDSGFARDRSEAKATVILTLKPSCRMNRGLLATIRGSISHAIDGLKPDNISLSDSRGNDLARLLEEENQATDRATSEALSALQERCERDRERKVVAMLRPLFGEENLSVTVTAQVRLPWQSSQPGKVQVARTTALVRLGGAARTSASSAVAEPADGSHIARLSISVLLNSRNYPGGKIPDYLRRSALDLATAAAGCRPERHDLVSVVAAPFRQAAPMAGDPAFVAWVGEAFSPYPKFIWVGGTLLLLVMLVVALRYSFPQYEPLEFPEPVAPPRARPQPVPERAWLLGLGRTHYETLLASVDTRKDLAMVLAAESPRLRRLILGRLPAEEQETFVASVGFHGQDEPAEVQQAEARLRVTIERLQ